MIRAAIVGGVRLHRRGAAAPAVGPSSGRGRGGHLAAARPATYVYQVHPNLRRRTSLKFSACRAPGAGGRAVPGLAARRSPARDRHLRAPGAARSSTSRPTSGCEAPQAYERWYGAPHAAPAWLERFVYGLPELDREAIRDRLAMSAGSAATPPPPSWRFSRWRSAGLMRSGPADPGRDQGRFVRRRRRGQPREPSPRAQRRHPHVLAVRPPPYSRGHPGARTARTSP